MEDIEDMMKWINERCMEERELHRKQQYSLEGFMHFAKAQAFEEVGDYMIVRIARGSVQVGNDRLIAPRKKAL